MKFNEDSRVRIPTILNLMRLGYGNIGGATLFLRKLAREQLILNIVVNTHPSHALRCLLFKRVASPSSADSFTVHFELFFASPSV